MMYFTLLRLQTNIFSLLALTVVLTSFPLHKMRRDPDIRLFKGVALSTMLIILIDCVQWFSDGRPGQFALIANNASSVIGYSLHSLPAVFYVAYTEYRLTASNARVRVVLSSLAVVCGLLALVAASSPWTGALFRIGADNVYARGSLFPFFAAFSFGIGALAMANVAIRGRWMDRRSFWSMILYPLIPILGGVLQTAVYGLVTIWPAAAISVLLLFINVQNRRIGTDYLTGVHNRLSLGQHLDSVAKRPPQLIQGGIMLDIDDFKAINDRLGHAAGDEALGKTAELLTSSVRSADTVYRYGGDEFVILAELRDASELQRIVARLDANIERFNAGRESAWLLGVSKGVGIYDPAKDGAPEAFIDRLDAAMYADKAVRNFKAFPTTGAGA